MQAARPAGLLLNAGSQPSTLHAWALPVCRQPPVRRVLLGLEQGLWRTADHLLLLYGLPRPPMSSQHAGRGRRCVPGAHRGLHPLLAAPAVPGSLLHLSEASGSNPGAPPGSCTLPGHLLPVGPRPRLPVPMGGALREIWGCQALLAHGPGRLGRAGQMHAGARLSRRCRRAAVWGVVSALASRLRQLCRSGRSGLKAQSRPRAGSSAVRVRGLHSLHAGQASMSAGACSRHGQCAVRHKQASVGLLRCYSPAAREHRLARPGQKGQACPCITRPAAAASSRLGAGQLGGASCGADTAGSSGPVGRAAGAVTRWRSCLRMSTISSLPETT